MSTVVVKRPRRKSILLVVALMVISLFTFALPASEASATGITRGPGIMIGFRWVGGYVLGGTTVYCPDPNKPPASPTGSVVTGSVSGATAVGVAKLNYLLTVYGTRTNPGNVDRLNNAWGAAIKLATWTYTGNKPLADQVKVRLPASVQNLLKSMIANTEKFYGPYRLVESITHPNLGKAGVATFKLVSIPTGRALPSQILSLAAANAKLAATTVSTGATGVVRVSFTKTTWANVRITATNKYVLSSTKIRLWKPPYTTYQRFLSAAPGVRVLAAAAYHVSTTNTGLSYTCDTSCNGVVPVTFTKPVCNLYGGTARFAMVDNGVVRRDFLQLAPGACGNKSYKVADTHSAQIELQVLVRGVWVKTRLANRIVVDCPPLPQLNFNGAIDCVKGSLNLSVPANAHAQEIIVNGVITKSLPGQAISVPTVFVCNQANSYTVRTAVQRHNGAWKTSPADTFAFAARSN